MNNIENLINRYIEYYKKIHPDKIIKNMFDEINYDDPTSTNHILEMFYEALHLHKNINNDVYETIENEDIDIHKIDDLYLLEMKGKKYISQSIISLLYILDNYSDEWFIVNLK